MKDLIVALRHAIAHFNIEFHSKDDKFLIDRIEFKGKEKDNDYLIATFEPNELLYFIRYYADWVLSNIRANNP